jgi:serine/threonine protein kinase
LKVDEKSDIFSFGVVLLELLTGRQAVETSNFGESLNIADWVTSKMQTKEGLLEVLDPDVSAGCSYVQEEMILVLRVALLCISRLPRDRPSMRDVVTMLSEAQPRRKALHNEPYYRPTSS